MKLIELNKGYSALVDDADYEWASKFVWKTQIRYRKDGTIRVIYVQRNENRCTIYLHRAVLGVTDTRIQVDHRNHDGLDNQRTNLRSTSGTKNQGNRRKQQGTSSQYKGVFKVSEHSWRAYIRHRRLGCFPSELLAAQAYDKAASKYFGEFALLNFPQVS